MISVSVWLPLRMPRSVETSKITACGRDLLGDVLQEDLDASALAGALSEQFAAPRPRSARFSRARPRYLAKLDLPEPKKPETQTPIALVRLVRRLRVALEDAR